MTDRQETSGAELARIRETVSTALVGGAPNSKSEMVSQALAVAVKPEFIDRINEAVGDPLDGETREQYIERGTNAIVAVLTELLIDRPDKAKLP